MLYAFALFKFATCDKLVTFCREVLDLMSPISIFITEAYLLLVYLEVVIVFNVFLQQTSLCAHFIYIGKGCLSEHLSFLPACHEVSNAASRKIPQPGQFPLL